ncbi:hypothetical protein HGM15179_003553 [Zosterops borbonicus]|uniref:Ig-like domain-containing protein n=1 Tax=Zosterops borbonicus TaxID=364589 RepID=A0A8K1LRE1_9PASS|nr:hypothetical protein HGM15179_003553 [Zosterops borbonicus]
METETHHGLRQREEEREGFPTPGSPELGNSDSCGAKTPSLYETVQEPFQDRSHKLSSLFVANDSGEDTGHRCCEIFHLLSNTDFKWIVCLLSAYETAAQVCCQVLQAGQVQTHQQKPADGTGPSIVTPPKDIWNVTGAQIYLSCEVIGIPTPVLIWNKIIRGQYGVQRMELLPGDRENLAIQTRGGPEKHEVTGWVLISPLSKEDAGEYECHASNAKGEATASAKIHVVETLHEIALTKDDGAEL